jgi:Ni,Fe-hydrogenase I large subunit
MAEPVEGRLRIRLQPGTPDNGVDISSSRPVTAARLFIDKPASFAVQTIPLLFNICGNAQLISSLRAIESARKSPAHDENEEWREALLLLETLREQLWRVLLEWPRLSHYEPDMEKLARFNRELNGFIQLLRTDPGITASSDETPSVRIDQLQWQRLASSIEEELFAGSVKTWLAENSGICSLEQWCDRNRNLPAVLIRDIFDRRWHSLGFSDYFPLSVKLDHKVHDRLESAEDASEFVQQPEIDNYCLETGPLARHDEHPLVEDLLYLYGNGLLTRMVARLADIADALGRLGDFFNGRKKLFFHRGSKGIASVEAARGRLTHRVRLDGDRITDYTILAPTEWNFHPQGVVARGLASLRSTNHEQLREQSEFIIHAVDPCVAYDLQIGNADA